MQFGTSLGRIHGLLGRSKTLAYFARNIRNQAHCVVAAHFSEVNGYSQSNSGRYNEYRLIDSIAPNARNFIDVGANAGLWSSRFIARMKQRPIGLIFEPHLERFNELRVEYEKYHEVKVVQAAVSDYIGTTTFYEDQISSELSSLSRQNTDRDAIVRRVPLTTLDQEVIAAGWNKVSIIKIDAEGEDFFCLRGARQILTARRVDFVQFECNSTWKGVTIVAAVNFLANLGYTTFQLHPNGLRAVDLDYFGECGSANWLAFHDGSPNLGLRIQR